MTTQTANTNKNVFKQSYSPTIPTVLGTTMPHVSLLPPRAFCVTALHETEHVFPEGRKEFPIEYGIIHLDGNAKCDGCLLLKDIAVYVAALQPAPQTGSWLARYGFN